MERERRVFSDRVRLHLARVEPVDLGILASKSGAYRCDQLFELGVDLSDAVEAYEGYEVDEAVVREAAAVVAVEAFKVWLSTCGLGREEARRGGWDV